MTSQQTFQHRAIAITGASGTLGRALIQHLQAQGAQVTALTSRELTSRELTSRELTSRELADQKPIGPRSEDPIAQTHPIQTLTWKVGAEAELAPLLAKTDILVLNHGVNVYGDRTPAAIETSYEVNAFSSWRLLELFLASVTEANADRKEIWVNTSEAESNPALSPLYELSKRTLGDLVTLRRLDAPCPIRKIILGPFKSELNPVGIMDGDRVAAKVVSLAQRGHLNIIVTINPLTFVTFPIKEFCVETYFRLFTQARA